MKTNILICCFLLLVSNLTAGIETMSVAEIKPGMRGFGKTVFTGSEIEEFEFEVLDIIPNFRSQRDLILVQLLGAKVEHTNVVAGMSGSPMYIEGKLIGALSYRLGLFNKDPIAGVTPIAQMLEILETEQVRAAELAANRGFNRDFLEMAVGARAANLQDLIPPYIALPGSDSQRLGDFVPLEIPLLLSGFEPSALKISSEIFGNVGLQPIQGGSVSGRGEDRDGGMLQPGSAYSVVLVDGDIGLQATGTVTHVEGDQVIGMGHPFFNSGAVSLPMGQARILTTISSLMASTKMSALTDIIGTVHQDRTTGVMGVSGEGPKMIPVQLSFEKQFGEAIRFDFRIADDRSLYSLTPLLIGLVTTNAIESARLGNSNQTLKLKGQINLKGYEPVRIENYYAGSTPQAFLIDAIEASSEVAAIVGAILTNNFETPEIESVVLHFEALPRKFLALIDRIEVDRATVQPGDEITVTAFLEEYQGVRHQVQQKLLIPERIRGRRLNIYAGGGSALTRLQTQSSPQKFRPQNFSHLLRLLNDRRKNNFVFFQILLPDDGISIDGDELPALPPSVLSVIKSQKSSGSIVATRDRVLLEESIETNYSVSGGRTVGLKIEQQRKRR